MDQCLAVIRTGIALRLLKKYTPLYGEDKAYALAGAVTNALFGAKPTNELGRHFAASNTELVEAELRGVISEPEICYMASLASHTLASVAASTGTVTGEMLKAWHRLDELGIMLPEEKIRLPSSLEELRQQASEFASRSGN